MQREAKRDREEFVARVQGALREPIREFLRSQPPADALSVSWVGFCAMDLCRAVGMTFMQVWAELLELAAVEVGLICPECGERRRISWRVKEPLRVDLLFGRLSIGKPYLSCVTENCSGRPLSVTHLLSGLRSGASGLVLKLQAARQGAEQSYGKAARSLEEHPLGGRLERGKLRRLAIEVEDQAVEYQEQRRRRSSAAVSGEPDDSAVGVLVLEGDGGKVRAATYRIPEPGEKGYAEKTPVRNLPRRRREIEGREVITLDVREPQDKTATALDALVPVTSPDRERQRLMFSLARRKGLGPETEIYGLGDMGSGLAEAFDEAFADYTGFWQADLRHTRNYMDAVVPVLEGLDTEGWRKAMWAAIMDRNETARDALLQQAQRHRTATLPAGLKCPIHALTTYLRNNWEHMHFRELKGRGLPVVSARAESQVRDRTKARFSVAGAWSLESIEPKAILRSIIAEGSFPGFAEWLYNKEQQSFVLGLKERVDKAVEERRLDAKAAALLADADTTLGDLLEFRNPTERRSEGASLIRMPGVAVNDNRPDQVLNDTLHEALTA